MKLIGLLISLSFALSIFSQNYSRVKISANETEFQQLLQLGINLDHAKIRENVSIEAELNANEIQKLDQSGISYEILVADLESFYENQVQELSLKTGAFPCVGTGDFNNSITTPVNFQLGSMGGYLTYAEFLANVDSMYAKYPNLIAQKAPISTFLTHETRPIYYLRISDNPGVSEGEEQVLYTAIHHAREPASLSQIIFYMWYLLENYATDPEIQYLINNTDMYFVPMLNPDGYIHNETTNPNGGGMWRKNKRNNGGGVFGVDLNRNYSYQWGVSGTSTNPNDETYLGPTPFSEPETQAIKWLCENNEFKFASNAHTYGDLLLFPYGYATGSIAADHDYFTGITEHMVMYNGYTAQKSSALYPAAGDSDDWMYDGDLGTKPKVYAMTPEIGSDNFGFWPPSVEIDRICKENIFPNMRLSHYPHIYGVAADLEGNIISADNGYFNFDVTRFGLTDGDFTVSITPLSGIQTIGSPKTLANMQVLDVLEDSISYTLLNTLNTGEEISYVLNVDNGSFILRDTIRKQYGNPSQVFNDEGNDMNQWSSSVWNVTSEYFVSPSTSITDRPNQNYANNSDNDIVSDFTVDLTNSIQASVSFWAKWDIENDYDYVQFDVSADNGATWTPMCGNYTNLGTNNQEEDEPLYDGGQTNWVQEEISLNDFLGDQIKFRFHLKSDAFVSGAGFFFDDFKVYSDNFNSIEENELLFSIYPNPNTGTLLINNLQNASFQIKITGLNGATVKEFQNLKIGLNTFTISDLESGMYILSIYDQKLGMVKTEKLIKN